MAAMPQGLFGPAGCDSPLEIASPLELPFGPPVHAVAKDVTKDDEVAALVGFNFDPLMADFGHRSPSPSPTPHPAGSPVPDIDHGDRSAFLPSPLDADYRPPSSPSSLSPSPVAGTVSVAEETPTQPLRSSSCGPKLARRLGLPAAAAAAAAAYAAERRGDAPPPPPPPTGLELGAAGQENVRPSQHRDRTGPTHPTVNRLADPIAELDRLFPKRVLRADKSAYARYKASVRGMTAEMRTELSRRRRREKQCVYAEQQRKRRLDGVHELETKLAAFAEDNARLKAENSVLKALIDAAQAR